MYSREDPVDAVLYYIALHIVRSGPRRFEYNDD